MYLVRLTPIAPDSDRPYSMIIPQSGALAPRSGRSQTSGNNGERPRRKSRTAFWFWKGYYGNCAGFRDLVEIRK